LSYTKAPPNLDAIFAALADPTRRAICLVASLLGVVVTMFHTINVVRSTIAFSAMEILIMAVMPVVVAVFLIWYSRLAGREEWIGWQAARS